MNDDNEHRWFIVIGNDRLLMMIDWQTGWLIYWLHDDKIMITRSWLKDLPYFQQSAGFICWQASCFITQKRTLKYWSAYTKNIICVYHF